MLRPGWILLSLVCLSALAQSPPDTDVRLQSSVAPWRLTRFAFELSDGVSRPVLTAGSYPRLTARTSPARISVSFDVTGQGIPVNIEVLQTSDHDSVDEVIALIREWRFEAALKNGVPVATRGFLDFEIGDTPNAPRRVFRKK